MNYLLLKPMIKKAAYVFIICMTGMLAAQKKAGQKFAICNDVVGTVKMFSHYKDLTEKSTFFKNKAGLPASLKKFEFLAENGLTEIHLKTNAGTPDIISLETLNRQYGLPENTPVSIDGYQFEDAQTAIYSEIVADGKVTESNGVKVLYLSTSEK